MKLMLIGILSLLAVAAHSEERRIHQVAPNGSIIHHKPSYAVQEDGRIIEVAPSGDKQYHKQQYQIKGDKIYPVDSQGNVQYHKPGFVVEPER